MGLPRNSHDFAHDMDQPSWVVIHMMVKFLSKAGKYYNCEDIGHLPECCTQEVDLMVSNWLCIWSMSQEPH